LKYEKNGVSIKSALVKFDAVKDDMTAVIAQAYKEAIKK
jgi:hypothetical protein